MFRQFRNDRFIKCSAIRQGARAFIFFCFVPALCFLLIIPVFCAPGISWSCCSDNQDQTISSSCPDNPDKICSGNAFVPSDLSVIERCLKHALFSHFGKPSDLGASFFSVEYKTLHPSNGPPA